MEERRLSFLESMLVSAGTGAATGAICGFAKTPDENRDAFTRVMVDVALDIGNGLKQRDRDGYIPGL